MNNNRSSLKILLCIVLLLLASLACFGTTPAEPVQQSPVIPPTSRLNPDATATLTPIAPPANTATFTPIAPPTITFTPIAPATIPFIHTLQVPTGGFNPATLITDTPIAPPPPPPTSTLAGLVIHPINISGSFIINVLSGKCIDVVGTPGIENKSPVQLGDCNSDGIFTDQKWNMTKDGFLQNGLSGKCLDVIGTPGSENGDELQLWDCEFSDPKNTDQIWQMTNDGFLVNSYSGKCLAVKGDAGSRSDAPLQLWDCDFGNPKSDQLWAFK